MIGRRARPVSGSATPQADTSPLVPSLPARRWRPARPPSAARPAAVSGDRRSGRDRVGVPGTNRTPGREGWNISSGRALALLVTAVVVIGVLFAFVFPIRTYMSQRRSIGATQARVQVLGQQNQQLTARVDQLGSDAEIERLAREQYGMVKPGEEPYAILPAPGSAPAALPSIVPSTPPAPKSRQGWFGRLWGHVEFWK